MTRSIKKRSHIKQRSFANKRKINKSLKNKRKSKKYIGGKLKIYNSMTRRLVKARNNAHSERGQDKIETVLNNLIQANYNATKLQQSITSINKLYSGNDPDEDTRFSSIHNKVEEFIDDCKRRSIPKDIIDELIDHYGFRQYVEEPDVEELDVEELDVEE